MPSARLDSFFDDVSVKGKVSTDIYPIEMLHIIPSATSSVGHSQKAATSKSECYQGSGDSIQEKIGPTNFLQCFVSATSSVGHSQKAATSKSGCYQGSGDSIQEKFGPTNFQQCFDMLQQQKTNQINACINRSDMRFQALQLLEDKRLLSIQLLCYKADLCYERKKARKWQQKYESLKKKRTKTRTLIHDTGNNTEESKAQCYNTSLNTKAEYLTENETKRQEQSAFSSLENDLNHQVELPPSPTHAQLSDDKNSAEYINKGFAEKYVIHPEKGSTYDNNETEEEYIHEPEKNQECPGSMSSPQTTPSWVNQIKKLEPETSGNNVSLCTKESSFLEEKPNDKSLRDELFVEQTTRNNNSCSGLSNEDLSSIWHDDSILFSTTSQKRNGEFNSSVDSEWKKDCLDDNDKWITANRNRKSKQRCSAGSPSEIPLTSTNGVGHNHRQYDSAIEFIADSDGTEELNNTTILSNESFHANDTRRNVVNFVFMGRAGQSPCSLSFSPDTSGLETISQQSSTREIKLQPSIRKSAAESEKINPSDQFQTSINDNVLFETGSISSSGRYEEIASLMSEKTSHNMCVNSSMHESRGGGLSDKMKKRVKRRASNVLFSSFQAPRLKPQQNFVTKRKR